MDVMENTERQQEEIVNSGNQPVIQPENSVQAQTIVTQPKMSYELDDYARQDGENIFDYISRVGKEKAEEYRTNVDRYTIRLRPEEYAQVNEVINATPDVQENSYKVAAAMKYSKLYEIPLEEAYANLDQFNYSIFGEEANKGYTKNFWNTLCDMLQLGQNTVDIGMIGGQLREAIDTGNTERANELRELYAKYKEQNDFLQQNLPQNLAMKIVESGAQSLPFTMGAIGMSVISPVTGFVYSAGVMAGQEYLDLTEAGASHETAKGVSSVVGAINGIVEVELGNVAGALGSKAAGSKAGELLRRNVIDKVTKNVAQKMHYSGGWRIVANVLTRSAMENLEEGAEEAVQETFSLLGKYIANEIDDLGIEGMTAGEIAKDLGENFMGGVYGSILLGSGTLISNSIAAKADYDAVKTAAEIIPSEKSFTKAVENSPVFEEMNEETKAQTIHEIYHNFGTKRDADIQKKAESLTEVISADEGMENYEAETDENGNELEAPEVPAETRDENGKLYSQQAELTENADGTYSGKKVYGDATKENNNLYGYINYTVDEEAGTVTIDSFKTNKYRQYLNNEMFTDFANEMKDYEIIWNPSDMDAKKWKADIEALNPSGKENGLNYFSTKNQTAESKADQQTRQRLVRELSQKFNLKGEEKALTVVMVEAMANSQGKSVSEWISEKFQDSGIMGNIAELEEAARQESIKQGKEIKATGGMTLIYTVKGVKAVIYAAEGADFSTALHEFSHVWTKGLSGDLEAEAANVFGATQNKDGSYNWDAPVTLENGKTVSAYENLAYSYEKWLETGKAPTPQHENIFKKFAEFMKNCVKTLRSAVKLTPETEDFFNKYFNVTEGMLKNAENAVIAEQENITKSGENLTNEVDAIPTEELLKAFEENNTEETPAESAVKETKLDPVTQEAVTSILEDPEIPAEKKVAAVMKANGEAFIMKQENIEFYKNRADLTEEERTQAVKDLEENNDTDRAGTGIPMSLLESGKSMLFQIIGEKGAKALDEANEETIRMDNKKIAEEMEAAGKDAKTIRLATGWEKGADGQWKYEIDDSEFKLLLGKSNFTEINKVKEKISELESLNYDSADLKRKIEVTAKAMDKSYDEFKAELQTDKDNKLSELKEELNKLEKGNLPVLIGAELEEVLDAPELYKAYPELKKMNVSRKTLRDYGGYQSGNNIVIAWGTDTNEAIRSTILHEVQHRIQDLEGFARGGTAEYAREKVKDNIIKSNDTTSYYNDEVEAYDEAQNNIDKLNFVLALRKYMENPEAFRKSGNWFAYGSAFGAPKNKADRKEYLYSLIDKWRDETLAKLFNYDYDFWELNHKTDEELKKDVRKQNYQRKKFNEEATKWYRAKYELERLEKLSDMEIYMRLAGEVEARNVQKRSKLTVEERREQLLSDTEDRRRDQQYVLFQEAEPVESENFKNWFKNSKVVDEEGNPKIMYHQTANDFDEFDVKYGGAGTSDYGTPNGIFLKPDSNNIGLRGNKQVPLYVSLQNPEYFIDRNALENKVMNASKEYKELLEEYKKIDKEYDARYEEIDKKVDAEYAKLYEQRDSLSQEEWEKRCDEIINQDQQLLDEWKSETNKIAAEMKEVMTKYFKDKGTDGIIIENDEGSLGRKVNTTIVFEPIQVKSATNNNGDYSTTNPSILFQTAFHGSGANFDKFDVENYGLSGEGSMSFGYGNYVSGSWDIAKDYASRQRPDSDLPTLYKGKEASYTERNAYIRLNQNDFNIEEAINAIEDDIGWAEDKIKNGGNKAWYDDYIAEDKKQIELLKSPDFNINDYETPDTKAKLYTVEIPDDGFMQWDQNVSSKVVEEILKTNPHLYTLKRLLDNYEQYKDNSNSTYLYGSNVYKALSKDLEGGDKAASQFLYNMGYKGIEYPAGTIYGNGEGARNFVIFNDADAKIVDKFLFQNEVNDDILNTAAGFDNWVDFMEYIQNVEPEMAPEEAASDWYLNTWEVAHNASPTSAEREAQVYQNREEQNKNEKKDAVFLDGLFIHEIQKEENLENFLKLANKVSEISNDEINALDAEDRAIILNELKKIETVLSHPTITMARRRLAGGAELQPKFRQRVINLMKGNIRDYRAIFADLTGRTDYAVANEDSLDAELIQRARRFNLIKYDSEVENMSPEQKKALEKYVTDKEILKKFRDDKVKMDDPDIEHYVSMLEDQAKNAEKMLKNARNEFQDDMEALGSMQMRDIIKQYNDFLQKKSEADYRKVTLPAGVKKALRLGEKAEREQMAGMRQNYNTLAANWDTFKTELEANIKTEERLRAEGKMQEVLDRYKKNYDATRSETVQELMKKAESLITLKKNHGDVLNELYAVRALKDQRKALVKRAMRRVNFSTIDYDQAKKIIAIQKVFEPNLFGGVNKWIGTEKAMAREVWTAWVTDEEAHDNILNRLSLKGKTDLIKLLEDTKTEEDFDKWTSDQQKALEKAMPVKDWVKALNLDAWKEERDGALQLDIKTVEKFRYETQKDGSKKSVPYEVAEMSPEVEQMVIDALGMDMAYAIQNRSFKDWTTGEMIELVKKINKLYKEGRDRLEAKREAERQEANRLRDLIRRTIKETGIVINPDDPEEVKAKKQAKINKILGVEHAFPGTAASKKEKQQTWLDRILHGYHDANVRRVARILDNYSEGTATNLLYFRENDCFNKEQRAIDRRNSKIDSVIEANKLDMRKLGKTYKFFGQDFTVDEILMINAAVMNQEDFLKEQIKEDPELKPERAEKESAWQAIVYGNLIKPEEREAFRKMDNEVLEKEKARLDKLHAAELAGNQDEIELYKVREASTVDLNGNLILTGTEALKSLAESRLNEIINGVPENTDKNRDIKKEYQDIIKEFKPLIEAIRADYASEFDNINRVSIEEFNAPVWREKWYLPLIRMTAAGDTHEQRLKQDLLGHTAGTGKAGTEKGFTKKRIKIGPLNQAPVELGLYKTWADSVERNEHFVAYAGLIREYNRVFDSRDALGMMQDMENRYGHAMTDYIKTYIKEVANPKLMEPKKGLDKVMHVMRGNTAPAYLGWKFSSILKQGIESPAPFMQFVNPAEYMHAAIRMATKKDVRESIEQKSAFMKSRVFDPMVDLINENVEKSFNKPNYLLKKFQQTGMAGLEWIDWACVAPGWLAIYDKEYRKLQETEQARYEARVAELTEQNETRYGKFHMSEEQIRQQAMDDVAQDIEAAAVLKADDCVRLCQPSNRNVDLAPMFKNNSEAAKAVLQFQTALNVIWQNIRYDIPYAMRNKEFKQIVGMIIGYVMAGVMSGMVCSGLLKDDDEPEDTAKRLGYYATTQFLDSFPIVGGNLDRLAERAITGEGGTMFGSSLWPTFDKYYNAASSFIKEDYDKAVNNMLQGLAISLGLPLSGTKEAMRAVGVGDGDGELELNPKALAGRRD